MVYYSKKDAWLIALLIGTLALSLLVGLYFIFVSGNNAAGYRWLLACSVAGFLVLLFTYPLHYTIGDTELLIRSGITLRRIPLDTIEEVSPVRDFSSSPAWSIDRLSILYMKKGRPVYIYISPAQKLEFQQELERKAPHLQRSGERLVRTPSSGGPCFASV
ncbi:MAG TPA: PH domain-containing protein [Pyrinomonadaceae bacterium]